MQGFNFKCHDVRAGSSKACICHPQRPCASSYVSRNSSRSLSIQLVEKRRHNFQRKKRSGSRSHPYHYPAHHMVDRPFILVCRFAAVSKEQSQFVSWFSWYAVKAADWDGSGNQETSFHRTDPFMAPLLYSYYSQKIVSGHFIFRVDPPP